MNTEDKQPSVEIVENNDLSVETLENCVRSFEDIGVSARIDDGSVHVHVGYDAFVEISRNEIVFRADLYTGEES